MTDKHSAALKLLAKALDEATKSGLFDNVLTGVVHPDVINRFCDAVTEIEDTYAEWEMKRDHERKANSQFGAGA